MSLNLGSINKEMKVVFLGILISFLTSIVGFGQEYPSYDYIEAMLYGMTYEEYLEMCSSQEEYAKKRETDDSLKSKRIPKDDGLPF